MKDNRRLYRKDPRPGEVWFLCSFFYSFYSQPILDCNMSRSRFKYPKSGNDKFKPVSEIVSFILIREIQLF